MESENENKIINNTKVYQVEQLELKQDSFIVITSRRNSGKSVLMRNLIKHMLDTYEFQFIMLFSDTGHFNDDYHFIDKNLIFGSDKLDEVVGKVLKIQEKNRKKGLKVHGMIILDDVKVYKKSKMLIHLAVMSRHFYLQVCVSVQYPKELISSSIRSNIDYLFFSDLNEQALMSCYQSVHVPYNFKTFQKFVDENNTNYQFIFYDSHNPDKQDRIKVVKSKVYENLRMINK